VLRADKPRDYLIYDFLDVHNFGFVPLGVAF
jgi:hypothetical protein